MTLVTLVTLVTRCDANRHEIAQGCDACDANEASVTVPIEHYSVNNTYTYPLTPLKENVFLTQNGDYRGAPREGSNRNIVGGENNMSELNQPEADVERVAEIIRQNTIEEKYTVGSEDEKTEVADHYVMLDKAAAEIVQFLRPSPSVEEILEIMDRNTFAENHLDRNRVAQEIAALGEE